MLATLLLAILPLQPTGTLYPSAEPQELEKLLQSKVEHYTLSEDTFLQALTRVAAEFEIPMGIEWVKSPTTLRRFERSWRNLSIYQILKSVLKAQSGYELQISNGVVHVFPRGALVDKGSFLNLRIDKFEVENHFGAFASYELHNRVHLIVSPPTTVSPEGGWGASITSGTGDRRINLKLQNVTVRDVLDRISLATDLNIWLVTYPEKAPLTARGFYRTLSLYTDVLADDQQPVWHLLPWGHDPIARGMRPDWKPRRLASPKKGQSD